MEMMPMGKPDVLRLAHRSPVRDLDLNGEKFTSQCRVCVVKWDMRHNLGMRLASLLIVTAAAFAQQDLQIPKNMKSYFVGFLLKGPKVGELSQEQQMDVVKRHLQYVRSQFEAGHYAIAGPFLDNGPISGMIVTTASSDTDAKALLDADPGVQAGIFKSEIHQAMLPDLSNVKAHYQ